jgi:hypothetical protein
VTGQLDDVAVYSRPLPATQVAAHYAARTGSSRLTGVAEPGGFTATTITYDHRTGRVMTLTDRHGAQWTLGAPVLSTNQQKVTVSSPQRGPVEYIYDTQHGGRMVSRLETAAGPTPQRWLYDDRTGFLAKTYDANNSVTEFVTDDRGNVTARTTCRNPDNTHDCHTEYFGYWPPAGVTLDRMDPRTDVRIWSADARSANANDLTYRTSSTIDAAGRPLSITYPKPAGQTVNPTETFTYTSGGGVPAGLPARHVARNGGVTTTATTPPAT